MKNIKSTKVLSGIDTWLLSHAIGLLAYAETDAKFAESLAHHIQSLNWEASESPTKGSVYLTPTRQTEAVSTANWLLAQLSQTSTARATKSHLAFWAKDFESPKDLVFGIVGMAIIGPTLGIINKKKRLDSKLQVLINKDWYQKQNAKTIATQVQNISMKLIAHELRLAGGNAYHLHPDTASWCLEEPLTKIYLASEFELESASKAAQAEHLSHQTKVTDKGLIAIAISPTVNDSFVTNFDIEDIG